MLLVIASNMVNQMPIPCPMECIASDYAKSCSRKYTGTFKQIYIVAHFFGALKAPIFFSKIGFCMASCLCIYLSIYIY